VSKYIPSITELSKEYQGQRSHYFIRLLFKSGSWQCKTKHTETFGTQNCLHPKIIRELVHCVQKVADPCTGYFLV